MLNNIRLVPLGPDGKPLLDEAYTVPVSTFDWVGVSAEPGDDDLLLPLAKTEYTMEISNIDIAALQPFFTPEPITDDSIVVEYGEHKIKGHLVYTGEEIVGGKVKKRYDMHDGVFICGPHDLEGNHVDG